MNRDDRGAGGGDRQKSISRRPILECVILVGLPGAGKTTFYRRYFAGTHRHVSRDLSPGGRSRAAQDRILDDAFARGESVVVDNTNPSRLERGRLAAVARAHGARVVVYFFDVTTREAVARNAERKGAGKVPDVAIFTAAKRLERPDAAEGFDQLFCVEFTPDRKSIVREVT